MKKEGQKDGRKDRRMPPCQGQPWGGLVALRTGIPHPQESIHGVLWRGHGDTGTAAGAALLGAVLGSARAGAAAMLLPHRFHFLGWASRVAVIWGL